MQKLPGAHLMSRSRPCGWLLLPTLVSTLNLAPTQAAPSPAEANWPAWRGPLGNGIAPQGDPPVTWSETNNVKWKVKVPGRGSATPIIWGNQVFVPTARATGKKVEGAPATVTPSPASTNAAAQAGEPRQGGRGAGRGGGFMRSEKPTEAWQFLLLCLDRETGQTLWQKIAREEVPHEGHHGSDGTFASSSPVTDGRLVFAYFGSRGLHAYDLQGSPKWSKDLGRMQIKNSFGEGSSPALFANTVVVNWDHEGEDFIAAFDAETGQERWRQPRDEDTSWATPFVVQHDGKAQVVISASRKVCSYDLATGKLLWECAGMTQNVIPTPVSGHGLLYAISGFRGSALLAIRLGRDGDVTGTDAIAWKHNKSTPYVPSPLLYDDKLYFLAGNNGVLSCFDAKAGRPLIDAERIEALRNVYASPVGVNGRVYLVGRDGAAVVIKSGDKLEILATNRLDECIDASPAVAGKDLFLRGRESLYCLAER
jgi:outer membrane protein assembly factor BamB